MLSKLLIYLTKISGLSSLVAASYHEDTYGIVQRVNRYFLKRNTASSKIWFKWDKGFFNSKGSVQRVRGWMLKPVKLIYFLSCWDSIIVKYSFLSSIIKVSLKIRD